MTRHSDTIAPVSKTLSPRAHAAILVRVATRTVAEAREAWRTTRKSSDEKHLRAAFRACVLAARSTRRASEALTHDAAAAHRLLAEAKRLDTAANELKARLAHAVVGAQA